MSLDAVNSGFPLLPEQQRLLDRAAQGGTWAEVAHLVQVEIAGELDLARLRSALDGLLQRFPVLATRIGQVPGYHGRRQLLGEGGGFPLQVMAEPGSAASLAAGFEAWASMPHPIEAGGHLGGLLQCCEPGRWRLSLGVARFIVDARSMGLLCQALFDAYEGCEQGACDEEAASFEQYLQWHAEVALDEDAAEGKRYWAEHLSAGGASPDLPYRRNGRIVTGRVESLEQRLDPAWVDGLERRARADGLPLERVLQAGWWALLARISGRSSLLAAWRHDARTTYEFFAGAPGVLERTLPLCQTFAGDERMGAACAALAARLEQHETWQEYWIAGNGAAAPALTCGFTSRPLLPGREIGGTTWQARALPEQAAEFDLLLQVLGEEGVPAALVLEYRADLYSLAAMQGLLAQYLGLLQALLEGDPELRELPPLGEPERARLLAFNPLPRDLGQADGLLPQRIARWAERTPEAIAMTCGETALTWRELDAQVRQLSGRLRRSGVGVGDRVGLALPRSIAWVVSLLAAWRVGAAYVPMDPSWPSARQAQVLERAGACLVLVATEVADVAGVKALQVLPGRPDEAEQDAHPAHVTVGEEVAYVLFTSGSTGMPKGVVIEHRNLFNYTAAASEAMGLEDCRQVAFSSSVSADLGNTALFGALYNGATLHVADDPTMQSPAAFARYLDAKRIDCLKMVPSHLAALLESERPNLPRTLVLGGEALPPALAERVLRIRPDCRLFNHYGPTETTVGVLIHPVVEADLGELGIPLTRVLANNRVHVLNEQSQTVAVGVLGELYIGGEQVSRGYLSASAEQRQAFVADPFNEGQVLYRSGDLARYRPEGGIQLYGRKDQQVKIRGHRVEPAETEQALLLLPSVTEAAVVVRQSGEGAELVAFVVVQGTLPEDPASELRGALRAYLPEAMLPAQVQVLSDMPRLANGKIDRQALQDRELQAVQWDFVAPRDALEELLCTRMAQLLGLQRLSMDQDFFASGGHSLLVIKLVAGIRKLLQCEANPGIVFDHPTPAALAQALRALETVPGQLLKLAQARLRIDALSPEERAALLEKARQLQAT